MFHTYSGARKEDGANNKRTPAVFFFKQNIFSLYLNKFRGAGRDTFVVFSCAWNFIIIIRRDSSLGLEPNPLRFYERENVWPGALEFAKLPSVKRMSQQWRVNIQISPPPKKKKKKKKKKIQTREKKMRWWVRGWSGNESPSSVRCPKQNPSSSSSKTEMMEDVIPLVYIYNPLSVMRFDR